MRFENQLLQFMAQPTYRPMKQHELAKAIHLSNKGQRSAFRHELYELEKQGKINRLRKNRWALPNSSNQIAGTVKMLAKGGAIFIPSEEDQNEIFISERNTGLALPNDHVLIEVFHSAKNERRKNTDLLAEGRVLKVTKRATHEVVGLLRHSPYHAYIIPDAVGFQQDVQVKDTAKGLEETPQNHKVVVELHEWTDPYKPLTGTLIEDLGAANSPGVDVDSLLRDAGLSEEFPKEVIHEANSLPKTISEEELSLRKDLREAITFTIDPETAKDYDDAVSIVPHPETGWILSVHIADVAHFIKPGTKIDKEAYQRGNSIYLVDRCVMMLPRELTTKVCSLNPKNDHLTHTAEIHLNEEGEMLSYKTYPSIIHSKARLTYTQVQKYIDEKTDHEIPELIVQQLNNLCPIINKVRARRIANGSVEINTPEIEIKLNAQGKVEKIMPRSESKAAYQLIEDCMLLANRAVAETFKAAQKPAMFRIHDKPDEEQWAAMGMELQSLGIDKLPQNRADINEAVHLAIGTPVEYTANLAILRNFKRAEYSTTQIGHFGLAFDDYTHFTSPIRRYPDLIVHRLLKAIELKKDTHLSTEQLNEMAKHCSETEKKADELEKKSIETKRIEYYNDILNQSAEPEVFKGYIVSIKGKGLIIELPESLQRGMITFASITSDWLESNDTFTQAVTRSGKVKFKLGDELDVCIAKVDTARNLLDFALADQMAAPIRDRRRQKTMPDLKTGKPRHKGKQRRKRR